MDVYKKVIFILACSVVALTSIAIFSINGCTIERKNGASAKEQVVSMGTVIEQLSGPIGTFAEQYIKLNDIIKQFNENQLAVGKVFEDIAVIMGERSINDRETNASLERLRASLDGTDDTARGIANEILGVVGDSETPAPAEDITTGVVGID